MDLKLELPESTASGHRKRRKALILECPPGRRGGRGTDEGGTGAGVGGGVGASAPHASETGGG